MVQATKNFELDKLRKRIHENNDIYVYIYIYIFIFIYHVYINIYIHIYCT